MENTTDQLEPLKNLIKEWGISLTVLADKMGMSKSTFKNKFYRSGGKYDFTESEEKLLRQKLFCFGADMQTRSAFVKIEYTEV